MKKLGLILVFFACLVSYNAYGAVNYQEAKTSETPEVQEVLDLNKAEDAITVYDGYIGKYAIRMTLNFATMEGSYYYKSKGPKNKLHVTMGHSGGYLVLFEYDQYGRETGLFRGTITGRVFSGKFLATQTGKKYNFRLTEKY